MLYIKFFLKLPGLFFLILVIISYTFFLKLRTTGKKKKSQDESGISVLMVNSSDNRGGAARIALDVFNGLLKRKYPARYLCEQKYSDIENIKKIKYADSYLAKFFQKINNTLNVEDILNFNSFSILHDDYFKFSNIVHLHNIHGNYFSILLLPFLTGRKKTLWTLHDVKAFTCHCGGSTDCERWTENCSFCPYPASYKPFGRKTPQILLGLKEKIINKSDLIITVPSDYLYNKVRRSILRGKKIKRIYNGIDDKIFKPADKKESRKIHGLPSRKIIIMFCAFGGINNPGKGGNYVVDAYNLLKDEKNLLFVFIGGETEKITSSRIDIPFTDSKEKLAMYYSAADIFLYPSIEDTFGLVVAEAMACRTPVVTFDTGGIPEIVDHMKSGYVARHKDFNDLMTGLRMYISDEKLREKSGEISRRIIEEKFSIEIMTENYINLYKEIHTN